jgi:hypothetical protein
MEGSEVLSFGGSAIESFVGLPALPSLRRLDLRDTFIRTFAGAEPQPGLVSINLLNTPLASERHLAEMCLIVFGNDLQIVNDAKIALGELGFAQRATPELRQLLVEGWLLTSLDPIGVYDPKTEARRTLKDRRQSSADSIPHAVPSYLEPLSDEKLNGLLRDLIAFSHSCNPLADRVMREPPRPMVKETSWNGHFRSLLAKVEAKNVSPERLKKGKSRRRTISLSTASSSRSSRKEVAAVKDWDRIDRSMMEVGASTEEMFEKRRLNALAIRRRSSVAGQREVREEVKRQMLEKISEEK